MKTIILKKILLACTLMFLAASPAYTVLAAGESDPTEPPAQGERSNERLERVWARQNRNLDRLGWVFERGDDLIEKAQELIERAAANGKDVSDVQSALAAFKAAFESANPIYDSATQLAEAHAGFDEQGNVTDADQAKTTVNDMRDKLREVREAFGGTGRDLRQAIKDFREANQSDK